MFYVSSSSLQIVMEGSVELACYDHSAIGESLPSAFCDSKKFLSFHSNNIQDRKIIKSSKAGEKKMQLDKMCIKLITTEFLVVFFEMMM